MRHHSLPPGPVTRREFLRAAAVAGTIAALARPAFPAAADEPLPWRVGTGIADITPPLEVGILMSTGRRLWKPFEGVRLPLQARVLVIEASGVRVAIAALDLLGLGDEAVGGIGRLKQRVADAAGRVVEPDAILLCSTHTHSAPESLGCTDLVHTKPFEAWVGQLADRIGSAIRQAAAAARPCRLSLGAASAPGHTVNRRIRTTEGVRPFRTTMKPEIVIGPEGPADESVQVAAFTDGTGKTLAMLVNAACHPVHEMCIPQISPDYPGELVRMIDERRPGCMTMFLNGAAGNLNPPLVSAGAGDAKQHAKLLADAVEKALADLRPAVGQDLALARRPVEMPGRDAAGKPTPEPLRTQVAALRIGDAAFCFLPGEPFIETSLAIREASPARYTLVVGYADEWIGYVATDRAFAGGGYETASGSWSKTRPGSEPIYRREAIEALRSLFPK